MSLDEVKYEFDRVYDLDRNFDFYGFNFEVIINELFSCVDFCFDFIVFEVKF